MKVLVLGGGGREHALLWKIIQSPKVEKAFCAPGNAGTAAIAQNLPIPLVERGTLAQAVVENEIDLIVAGPEGPLANGIVDSFQALQVPIFGPTRDATQIESSKVFAYKLMKKYGIPCPPAVDFSDYGKALEYVKGLPEAPVIKADGLAKGKGVTVCETMEQALETLHLYMIEKIHSTAGERVLVQERREGREASVIAFTDGETVAVMPPACDYKNVYDGNRGPMTGGMGSYCPLEFLGQGEKIKKIQTRILERVLIAMKQENRPYKGVIYAGLIFPDENPDEPEVLEFNARLGDPEAQVQFPLLKTDLVDIMLAVNNGTLDQIKIEWSDEPCVGVVMASEGYPGKPITDREITGLDDVDEDVMVFHAGTKFGKKPGEILTSGGRVLTVVATGKTLVEARDKVYANVPRIHFEGCHYREDIALL
jgi:phosphoribosylamine--glycine ligase